MSGKRLHIVVSCTDRKRAPVTAPLRLRSVFARSIPERVERWWTRIRSARVDRSPARNLYAGELWSANCHLATVAERAGFSPTLWVASAGYGLIESTTLFVPYSATFSLDSPDSVAHDSLDGTTDYQNSAWWATLATQSGVGRIRTVAALAAEHPQARFLVVASPRYVAALANDLLGARSVLKDPDKLLIVSSDLPSTCERLRSNQVVSTSRLLFRVGGTRIALHARVAADVLATASLRKNFSASELRRFYARIARRSVPPSRQERKRLSDAEVRQFIKKRGIVSYSAGVRELRASGFACEQKRFRALFKTMRGAA